MPAIKKSGIPYPTFPKQIGAEPSFTVFAGAFKPETLAACERNIFERIVGGVCSVRTAFVPTHRSERLL